MSYCVPILERLAKYTQKGESCWLWTGLKDKDGYGKITFNGESVRAHRLVYDLFKEKVAKGEVICHSCDNVACVNPDHLWRGTSTENRRDCVLKKRQARHASHGMAKLTEEQVLAIRQMYKPNVFGQQRIAKLFNVSKGAIQFIISGGTWKQ